MGEGDPKLKWCWRAHGHFMRLFFLHFSLRTFIRGIWNSILISLRYFNFFSQSPSFLPPTFLSHLMIFFFLSNVLSLKGFSLLSLSQHQFSLSAFSWRARNDFFFLFVLHFYVSCVWAKAYVEYCWWWWPYFDFERRIMEEEYIKIVLFLYVSCTSWNVYRNVLLGI